MAVVKPKGSSDHGWFHGKRRVKYGESRKVEGSGHTVNYFPGASANDMKHYKKPPTKKKPNLG